MMSFVTKMQIKSPSQGPAFFLPRLVSSVPLPWHDAPLAHYLM